MNEQQNSGDWLREQTKQNDVQAANDNVNHPAHYTDGNIEVIEFIEDKRLPYHLGNAIKYISRAGKKSPDTLIEDLEKAVWYINRYINLLKERCCNAINKLE